MATLSDLGLSVGDIELGGIDAEADPDLDEYFVTTPYVRAALEGKRRLLLGRKGSGKSALFTQLPRLTEAVDPDCTVIQVTPDSYAWAALRAYKEQGLLSDQAHANAWKLTLAVEVASHLLSIERVWSQSSLTALGKWRKFLRDNYETTTPSLQVAAASMQNLTSLNVSAFGFGIGVTRRTQGKNLTPSVVDAMLQELDKVLSEQRVLVALDQLDDSWDGSAGAKSLLVGLLKATKSFNDRYAASDAGTGLGVITFLREDIYDALQYDDKDKHRATEEHIVWTPDLLKEMLGRRLPEGVEVDGLFEAGDMRGSISPFSYVAKRTFLRPREILQFVEECMKQASPAARAISKADIRDAEETYSRWKVEDLKQEFQKVFPDFARLLDCLRQGVHRYDSVEDIGRLLSVKEPTLVADHGTRVLLETLVDCSVLGIRVSDAGSTRFKCEDPDLVLPEDCAVYVHQSLYKGLSLREKRVSKAESTAPSVDVISVELYQRMMSEIPITDLAFLGVPPTPVSIFDNESFDDCASSLGIDLKLATEDDVSLRRPNEISEQRLAYNRVAYDRLREAMKAILRGHGATIERYVEAERKSTRKPAARRSP